MWQKAPGSPPTEHLPWVQSPAFDAICGVVILLNTIIVVVETDFREPDEELGWAIADSVFTIIFLAEVVLKMLSLRTYWPRSVWNIFDLLLVISSIIDVWILPFLKQEFQLRPLTMLRVVRLLRMLRVIRLLRVMRRSQKLMLLVNALWGALRALFWAMVLLVGVLYVVALLIRNLTGMDDELREHPKIQEWFGSLPRSFFTLFQLMTMEGWPDIARETLDTSPWLTIFYISFILLTNVTLLNIVAGVLTENVLSTSRQDEARRQEMRDEMLVEEREAVGQELAAMDENDDGMLDLQELRAAEASQQQAPHLALFLRLADLSPPEAEELFHVVDFDETGTVTYKDYVDAARRARGPIKPKHIIGLKRDIVRLSLELDNVTSLLEQVSARAAALWPGLSDRSNNSLESESPCVQLGEVQPLRTDASRPWQQGSGEAVHLTVADVKRDFFAKLRSVEARLLQQHQAKDVQAYG